MSGSVFNFYERGLTIYCSHNQQIQVCECLLYKCVSVHRVCESVSVCCSVLQCVAVCCSVLQCVAVCCSVLQYLSCV